MAWFKRKKRCIACNHLEARKRITLAEEQVYLCGVCYRREESRRRIECSNHLRSYLSSERVERERQQQEEDQKIEDLQRAIKAEKVKREARKLGITIEEENE
jgi:hypothetical protein